MCTWTRNATQVASQRILSTRLRPGGRVPRCPDSTNADAGRQYTAHQMASASRYQDLAPLRRRVQPEGQALSDHFALHRHLADSHRWISASGTGRVAHARNITSRKAAVQMRILFPGSCRQQLALPVWTTMYPSAKRYRRIEHKRSQHRSNATWNSQPRSVEPRNVILGGQVRHSGQQIRQFIATS